MLSKLRIGPKLLLAPGVMLILLIALSTVSYAGLVRQNQRLEALVQQRAVRLKATAELVAGVNRAHTEIYQLLTWGYASYPVPRTSALVDEIRARHAALVRQFALPAQARRSTAAEQHLLLAAQAAHAQYLRAIDDVLELYWTDQSIATNAMSKAEHAFDRVSRQLEQLSQLEQILSTRAYHDAQAEFQTLSTAMPALVVLSITLSLLVTLAVRRAMLRDVAEIGAAAVGLAEGDLTVKQRVYGRDEIGETARALDSSIRNLNSTLKTIVASVQSIDNATRDIVQGNLDLNASAVLQRRTLAQADTAMQRLSATMRTRGSGSETVGLQGLQGMQQAIVQIGEITQQKLVLVEQAALAAARLQGQALSLSQAVAQFKLDEGMPAPSAMPEPAIEHATVPEPAPVVRLRLASVRHVDN